MANHGDPCMTVNFRGLFRLDEEVSGQSWSALHPHWFRAPIYLPMIHGWYREVFVHFGQEPASFGRARCVWLTGEVYARTELRDTMIRVRAGFAVVQDDYVSQLPAPLPIITAHSRGYVLRFDRRNFDRWIIVALHNISDNSSAQVIHFNVFYEASNEVVAAIGEEVFKLGNIVNFHGEVMHYFRRSGKWVVKLRAAHSESMVRPTGMMQRRRALALY
ncbi:uncharacterized protein MELLADRAFT_102174 [Melampsora larici-populina 98AG31]|uniref:Uncharacterized protein n=1 Tax=Melampsora larici-populina (strain 98AG31 / pathotype 3-4-7) TaxID=747676 RepID=F4R7F5_MELLP|nr:uncharacterized protein MELLADRAFT_102174 [Melampsora larici-populina 98AG31]EGG11307.1 hypothetical protein MELLADRAFT_102174 [Melampsora larici-populina 98AG31]